MIILGITDGTERCECHRCGAERRLADNEGLSGAFPLGGPKMILCGECGNKRCPMASDHRYACTQSNEPGQEGSVYQ